MKNEEKKSQSAKIIKGVFYILGLLTWYMFGSQYISKSYRVRVTYLSLLSLQSISASNSSTELILWASIPILSILTIKSNEVGFIKLLLISTLFCLLISIKYTN